MLTALNTGHEGGCGTLHANAAADVPARFEALGALAGLGRESVQTQLASAIEAIVHVERTASGRAVASLSVLRSTSSGLQAQVAYDALTGSRSEAWPALAALLAGAR
jgi:pilus assembly protein CpaF